MAKNYRLEYEKTLKEIEKVQSNILNIDNQIPELKQNYIIACNSGYRNQAKGIEKTIIKLENNRSTLIGKLITLRQKSEMLLYNCSTQC